MLAAASLRPVAGQVLAGTAYERRTPLASARYIGAVSGLVTALWCQARGESRVAPVWRGEQNGQTGPVKPRPDRMQERLRPAAVPSAICCLLALRRHPAYWRREDVART